jgi:ribosomal protein S14
MRRHKFYFENKINEINKKKSYIYGWYSLKFIKNNEIINFYTRQYITTKLHYKYRLYNLNKLKLFCVVTGRTKGVMKNFKLSRMSFIESVGRGEITGFYKN